MRAALVGHAPEPVVRASDPLPERRVGHQVPTELLPREFVKGLVLVEGPDHVVSIRVDIHSDIAVEPDGVRVSHQIEPMHGHALAVVIGVKQLVDESLERVRP